MRKTILVTLWVKIVAIVVGIVCSLFGVSFFYFGTDNGTTLHSETITANEWLFNFWLCFMAGSFVALRVERFKRIAALLVCWSVQFVPLVLTLVSFVESCLTHDSFLARYHRMECMVILFIGLLLEGLIYYNVFWKKQQNA
jgi:hypothetical protein